MVVNIVDGKTNSTILKTVVLALRVTFTLRELNHKPDLGNTSDAFTERPRSITGKLCVCVCVSLYDTC